MHRQTQSGVTIVHGVAEQAAAEVIEAAVDAALRLIQESWGLKTPAACRIYVMTSWWGFFFQSAPWPWRMALAAALPLWVFRARAAWPISAAWTQRYGQRVAIGIKPPRLLTPLPQGSGVELYVAEPEPEARLRLVTCHELTHACSAHLRLPAWLNEGLAAATADRFLGRRSIRSETLALVRDFTPKAPPPDYRQLARLRGQPLVYHVARGYWLVHYLEEKVPGALRRLCASDRPAVSVEAEIAAALGLAPSEFWDRIDGQVAAHFVGGSPLPERGQPAG